MVVFFEFRKEGEPGRGVLNIQRKAKKKEAEVVGCGRPVDDSAKHTRRAYLV